MRDQNETSACLSHWLVGASQEPDCQRSHCAIGDTVMAIVEMKQQVAEWAAAKVVKAMMVAAMETFGMDVAKKAT